MTQMYNLFKSYEIHAALEDAGLTKRIYANTSHGYLPHTVIRDRDSNGFEYPFTAVYNVSVFGRDRYGLYTMDSIEFVLRHYRFNIQKVLGKSALRVT